ncbi:MAG: class I SAM-dependent methyltransferase [Rhodococcus sp.]|nr:class I SAM-dependent methyltransferase [Rhodococcus sp. (in: high G+C Gram-positive bacteria)]
MAEEAGQNSPGVMLGGVYQHESRTQHDAAAIGYPLIAAAIAGISAGLGSAPVIIADFGAAQANNSLRPVALALDRIRSSSPDVGFTVVHTDLPHNDFATLFDVVDRSPESYLNGRAEVFPFVAGRSFYDRIFPPSSLTFGWSSSSLHWLSAAPAPIPDHFFVHLSEHAPARHAYRACSQDDWTSFLDHRSVELAPGGGLVVVDVLRGDDGLVGSEALFDCLESALRQCRDDGLVTHVEYDSLVYPTWFRSVDELRAPFTPNFVGSAGNELALLDCITTVLEDPFAALLERGEVGDYASAQAGFLRGFLSPSFESQLDPGRSSADKNAVLDEIWRRTAERIAADPHAAAPAYRLSAVRIRRL